MIIKSMSRKAPTFSQLADYIGQDGSGGSARCFARNLNYEGDNQDLIARLFWDNYQHLPTRKNGNALYHEVLVLEPQPHLSESQQMQILHALARQYCQARAPHQLAWGRVHFDTNHPHIHLMISANALGSNKRARLDRKSFARIQKDLEHYKESTFPELVEQRVYNRPPTERVRTSSREGELVRRSNAPSKKQVIAATLSTLLTHHQDRASLAADMARAGLEFYQRGKSVGVKNTQTGKRYRLHTLGLNQAYQRFQARVNSPQKDKAKSQQDQTIADRRAKALLKRREQLDRYAEQELNRFDQPLGDGPDR